MRSIDGGHARRMVPWLLVLLAGCNVEVNVHLNGSEEAAADRESVTEAPTDPLLHPAPPEAPRPPAPPAVARPLDGSVRDALWRPWLTDEDASQWLAECAVTRYDVPPRALDGRETARVMAEAYPPLLREAGIEGEAAVCVLVGIDGRVREAALARGTGHEALDDAALRAAWMLEFRPATLAGVPVAARFELPISFRIR